MLTAKDIKVLARETGFDLCGVAQAEAFPELRFLDDWLERGYGGEMHYMKRTARRRRDVREVVPLARSVVSLATLYNTDNPYSTELDDPAEAKISRYAWGADYHDVLQRRTETLLDRMRAESTVEFEARCYVDTGPVQERVYARHAGLGWIGKNTCLIHPERGSWFFLSEIITTLTLEADAPQLDQCGTCTLCLEACPTDALRSPGVLDSNRCLSYLTIELRGSIPESKRVDLDRHVYGCDICQEVCPYNAASSSSDDPAWQPRLEFDRPTLVALWRRSDNELDEQFKTSAMSRVGLTGFRRNVAVALGNVGTQEAATTLDEPTTSGTVSRRDPTVAEHIAWAHARLSDCSSRK